MPLISSDTDECLCNPCMHEATCIDGINSYICTCLQGFTGIHCETGNVQFNISRFIIFIFVFHAIVEMYFLFMAMLRVKMYMNCQWLSK